MMLLCYLISSMITGNSHVWYKGIAFRDLKGIFYPSIGLRTSGESIEVNFGQKEFKFAIDQYMKVPSAFVCNLFLQ
jgi:hypothetical protein